MIRRKYEQTDDRILSLNIRIQNILDHFKLLTNMIHELQRDINKMKLKHIRSEEILTPYEQEDIFNSTGSLSFEASNGNIPSLLLKK